MVKQVESIMENFLLSWSRSHPKKMHTICWDAICKPFDEGGLNIKKVKEINDACILKHLW